MHSMSRIKIIQTSDAHCFATYGIAVLSCCWCCGAQLQDHPPHWSHTHTKKFVCGKESWWGCSWSPDRPLLKGSRWPTTQTACRVNRDCRRVEWLFEGDRCWGYGLCIFVCAFRVKETSGKHDGIHTLSTSTTSLACNDLSRPERVEEGRPVWWMDVWIGGRERVARTHPTWFKIVG